MTFQTRTSIPEEAAQDGLLAVLIGRAVLVAERAGAHVASWARSVRGVVTGLGWSMIGAAVLALGVGYIWGWTELIVLGWGLVVVIAVASLWLLGRGAGAIELTLPVNRVEVGESALARIVTANPGRRRLGGVRFELPVGDRVVLRTLPVLPRGGAIEEQFPIPTSRRGVVLVGPARTVRADPIGLMHRELVWAGVQELHVHPRTAPISALSTGFVRDLEGSPTRDLTVSDIAFHALREYLPGDDRRHIHWRSSAKTGVYMVRQFEQTRRSRIMVILDLDRGAYADEAEFELAVSAAASVGARAIRDSRTLSFLASGPARHSVGPAAVRRTHVHELPTASRDRLLDALCLVEPLDRAPNLPDVARAAGEAVQTVSLAFIVTGSRCDAGRLRAASARLPVGVETIGVRCAPEGEATARGSAGIAIFDIGYLDDLRAMLSRSASVA